MASRIKVATWNLKQAVAPRAPLPKRWAWAEQEVGADVYAFTEAAVPADGPPSGWTAIWEPGGIGPRRRWGTVLAARNGVELVPVTTVKRRLRSFKLELTWPAATIAADVMVNGERWATLVAVYAMTVDRDGRSIGSGSYSVPVILGDLELLIESRLGERLVVAGDLNLWPDRVRGLVRESGLVDLIEQTAPSREPLDGCVVCAQPASCGHIWTHKNGNRPNAKRQQIDYILASPVLAARVRSVRGGPDEFPEVWDMSDHAPVVAEFDI